MNSFANMQLVVIVFCIAFLYASVGAGGASGYLAAMSIFALPHQLMASTALMLNVLVASIAFVIYYRHGNFTPRLLWPFLLTSVPASFLGGTVQLESNTYLILLYLVLSYVTLRLLSFDGKSTKSNNSISHLPIIVALACGACIGLLSGLIGIGGGIILSPLIILARWGTTKQAASSAAGFVLVNSLSGLAGSFLGNTIELGLLGLSLIPVGLLGALGGSLLGARYLSGSVLRRILGVLLLIAVLRFWVSVLT